MPVVNIEENIKMLRGNIDKLTQEMYRLQGVLQTFEGFRKGGLETIDLPNIPNQTSTEESAEDLESIQQKPE